MFLLGRPSDRVISDFIAEQGDRPFSYPEVGASLHGAPDGYAVNHRRTRIGEGEEDFLRAKNAIRAWVMYRLDWGCVLPAEAPIEPGRTVGLLIRTWFLWSLNACRIIYVVDEEGGVSRYGFGFGTTAEHAVAGEERFLVEWDDGGVWYEIFSFSRPHHPLARIGRPILHRMQKRFARDSTAAMIRAVSSGVEESGGAE